MFPKSSIKKALLLSFLVTDLSLEMQSAAQADSFEGPYAGLTIGYSDASIKEGNSKWSQVGNIDFYATGGQDSDGEGVVGGLNLGYDWRFNNFAIGAEVGGTFLNNTAHGVALSYDLTLNGRSDPVASSTDLKSLLTAKAKLGYVIDEETLVYGLLGIAQGRVTRTVTGLTGTTGDVFLDSGVSSSTTRSLTGYTVGAGVEKILTPELSIKLEFNYVDLGYNDFTTGGTTFGTPSTMVQSVKVTDSTATIGLAYRF